jgi:acyl-CoA reductase-like NAD-dependent aldehyde dehydrogenase
VQQSWTDGANCIGGRWIDGSDGPRIAVINPATGATLGDVPNMGRQEAHAAVAAVWASRTDARPDPGSTCFVDPRERLRFGASDHA